MRKIHIRQITQAVAELCGQANTKLRPDVFRALTVALIKENNRQAQDILKALLKNANCARRYNLAICQDTGLPYVFVELGQAVAIYGGDFLQAINKGLEQGYRQGGLRNSIVSHPLKRNTRPVFSPGVVHIEMVKGNYLNITLFPKGFGSENKSAVKMFKPTDGLEQVKEFIVQTVKQAGPDACPPYIIGVGIGGGLDQAALLAKKALLRSLNQANPDRLLARLEQDLRKRINQLGVGPQGLGGRSSCLGVNILAYPTHIAGLPVAVNISCHALRSASRRL